MLKHKLRPENAYFQWVGFDPIQCAPKEELHQILIGLYGEHLLPATKYQIEQTLRGPGTIKGFDKNGAPKYIISKARLRDVYARLRNRLASVGSSTSTIEITSEYAAHFYDMYIKEYDGKHMTGDRMKVLMLNLPFLLRDLLKLEVNIKILYDIGTDIGTDVRTDIVYHILVSDHCFFRTLAVGSYQPRNNPSTARSIVREVYCQGSYGRYCRDACVHVGMAHEVQEIWYDRCPLAVGCSRNQWSFWSV